MPIITYPHLSEAVLTAFPYFDDHNDCSSIYDCVSYCSTCKRMKVYCGNCGDTYYDNDIYTDHRLIIIFDKNKKIDTSVPILLDDADPIRNTNIAGWIESNGLVYTFKDTLIPIMELATLGQRNLVILIQDPRISARAINRNKYAKMRKQSMLHVEMSRLICQDLYEIIDVQLHKINDDIIAVVTETDID